MVQTHHKVPHFTKRKYRLIVKLFSEDLTAVQASEITGLNRNTINLWF
ncbi:MAG: IS1595 family transposase, partial [Rickettsiales bacterium]|nr:IS1595 family transposase [Rickettsiales bacterium]